MIGTGGVGVNARRSHAARQRSGNKTEIDSLVVVGGHTFIFAVAGGDPGVDESGEPML
jgi:hypothetical protein